MRHLLALLLPLALASCATPSAVGEAAPSLHRGAIAAEQQTEALFRDINAASRAGDIDRVLAAAEQPGPGLPTLKEADFTELVEPATRAQWSALFDAIAGYTTALVELTDPSLAAGAGDSLQGLGTRFGTMAGESEKVGKVSGVVGAVGAAILGARAEATAGDVVRRVDPAFNDLMLAMADALGTSDADGLRGTVADLWKRNRLQVLQDRFAGVPRGPDGSPARRQVADEYLRALAARDAGLADLARLRGALLALGAAHRAAAADDTPAARAWIDRLERLVADIAARTKDE